MIQGADRVGGFDKNPGSDDEIVFSKHKRCNVYDGYPNTEHPAMGLIDVPTAVIRDFSCKPVFRVHHRETVQAIVDGPRKFRYPPKEAGTSRPTNPESV